MRFGTVTCLRRNNAGDPQHPAFSLYPHCGTRLSKPQGNARCSHLATHQLKLVASLPDRDSGSLKRDGGVVSLI